MKWNDHKEYEGKHAFMSPSGCHWLNYDAETLENRYYSQFSQSIGTVIHQLAHDLIVSRTRINKHDVHLIDMALWKAFIPKDSYDANRILDTLIPFVNDAIGFHMSSEIVLFYNAFCFGTADAIVYDEFNKVLRIHDLKTGLSPAKIEQCYIYAALFCIEYNVDPYKLKNIECRLYQNLGEMPIFVDNPPAEVIDNIINIIKNNTQLIATYLGREGR